MRKAAIIFLTTLYILGATEAYQLLKLPFLFEHYKTHQKFNQQLSFSKFIEIHYFTSTMYSSDYQQDMQLPFKSSNRTVSMLNFDSFFIAKLFIEPIVFFSPQKIYLLYNDLDYASNKLDNIFQPPRA
ncbi:MAG: hypothetical protein ACR2IM_04300 [Sediminibacterium sp.]